MWEVRVSERAAKLIKKLRASEAREVRDFLRVRLAKLDDRCQMGKALQGSELGSFWRYRVGNYRILCELRDGELVVLVVEVGHRRDVYRP